MLQMSTALILRREALIVKKINPYDNEIFHIHLSLNIDLKEKNSIEYDDEQEASEPGASSVSTWQAPLRRYCLLVFKYHGSFSEIGADYGKQPAWDMHVIKIFYDH